MSKFIISTIDSKIIIFEYSKPTKKFNEHSGEFSRFEFEICPVFSKQDKEKKWVHNFMKIKCIIWDEKIADKFSQNLNLNYANYISITNGELSSVNSEDIEYQNKNGEDRKKQVYSYLSINVRYFTITNKPIKEKQSGEIQTSQDDQLSQNNLDDSIAIDDEIPF